MNVDAMRERLSAAQVCRRAAVFAMMITGAVGLRAIDPVSLSWLPFRTSCGATTGLPCIFCGTTRALHHLLNGEVAQALYFNWLAFPIAALAFALGIKFALELAIARKIAFRFPTFSFTPRLAALCAASLAAIWVLQVSLVVSQNKGELLNPNGPLYALFVK